MKDKQLAKNLRLLEAIRDNNSQLIGETLEQMRPQALSIASNYDLDDPEDAVSKAIEKVLATIPTLNPQTMNNPPAYLLRMIHNNIIDQVRGKKEESLSPEDDIRADLAWVDENISPDDEGEQQKMTGWRGYRVKRLLRPVEAPSEFASNPTLRGLLTYLPDEIFLGGSFISEGRARWIRRRYRNTSLLVATLPTDNARGRVTRFLQGYRVKEIANQEGVSEQTVSRTIKHWLTLWGWTKDKVKEARMIWLVYNLADIGKQAGTAPSEPRSFARWFTKWSMQYDINEELKKYEQIDKYLPSYQSFEFNIFHKVNKTYVQHLYHLTVEDPRVRAYFCNLSENDMFELARLFELIAEC